MALKSDSELVLFKDTSVLSHVENMKTGTVSDVDLMYQVSTEYYPNVISSFSTSSSLLSLSECYPSLSLQLALVMAQFILLSQTMYPGPSPPYQTVVRLSVNMATTTHERGHTGAACDKSSLCCSHQSQESCWSMQICADPSDTGQCSMV